MITKWYYQKLGEHIHATVFCNGANCGSLVMKESEFAYYMEALKGKVEFVNQPSK